VKSFSTVDVVPGRLARMSGRQSTLLHQLGYKQVKALVIPSNLEADWTAKGYPLEKGQ
jgi:hypothetical protein